MATVNLVNEREGMITDMDNVVIVDNFQSIRGGRTLDVTGFAPTVIQAGHPIIRETATDEYKPMPLNGGGTAYAALPAGHTYAGVLNASIYTAKAFAGILVRGTVNPVAAPFDYATILAALRTALPLIDFRAD